ncbi:MAG: isopeptide-forming domain-containing fimbrial protein, partial [Actinomycetia bacterium]|nr:isopeptide-forming domain-containing fimbrial protein [Actinomycetes bacterium]
MDNLALAKTIDDTSEASTADPYVAVGEIVRYRLVVTLPEGTSENLQLSDLLPAGMLFLNDGTARLALVSDDAPMASTNPTGDTLGLGLGAGTFAPVTPPWVSGTDHAGIDPTFVLPGVNVGSTDSLTADPDAYGSGIDPWFKLGTIVNADSDADGEYAIIEFNALVENIAGNDAGVSRANQAQAYVDGSQMVQSGSVSITIAEPSITDVAKGVDPATGDAGDQMDFTVTFSNAGGATNTSAFDARVLDTMPADLSLIPGSIGVAGAGGFVDNSPGDDVDMDITITEVVKGASVTVTYSATIDVTAAPTGVITNTATLTYTSTPGANGSGLAGSTIPGAAGADTGERNHSDGAGGVDDYTDDDDASLTMDNLALAKTIDDTSEASTVDPYVAVGEIVRYRLVATLPEGTSENLQLSDLLPAGMIFLNDGTATLALVSDDAPMASTNPAGDSLGLGLGAGTFAPVTPPWVNGTDPTLVDPTFVLPDVNVGDDNSLAADNDAYASDTDPWFKLGTIVNADSDDDGEYVIIEFNALVMNIAGNDAGVSRSNQTRAYVDGSQMVQSGAVSITIAEPSITDVAKDVDPATGDAGDQMDFTITFSNAGGATNTSAFDARVLDTLPDDLTFLPASVVVTPAGGVTDNSAADTVDITVLEILKGNSVTVEYSAVIDASAAPAQEITNTAMLIYSSLPGANGTGIAGSITPGVAGSGTGERDHSDGAGGLNGYTDDDDAMLTIESPTLNTLVDATSEAATTANEHTVGVDDLTVGETATFHISADIPEGTSPAVVFIDTLAYTNGVMEVVSSRPVSIGGITTGGATAGGNLVTDGGLGVDAPCVHSDVQLAD